MPDPRPTLAGLMREQARWCESLGSALYHRLLLKIAEDIEASGPCLDALIGREDDDPLSMLALRFLGAINKLVLADRAPELAARYGNPAGQDAWPAFASTVRAHRDVLRHTVLQPVQTNEVGRSVALVGGFLQVARETRLPLGLLEVGASGGLNLRWHKYRYFSERGEWGDAASLLQFKHNRVAGKPPFDTLAEIVEARGCDAAPLDVNSEADRRTLLAYVWPDQTERLANLRSALAIAQTTPASVTRADALDWLTEQLAEPKHGVATIVYHSAVIQYFAPERRRRFVELLRERGQRATSQAPLAWLTLEPPGKLADIRLTLWPNGSERVLAKAGYHGKPVEWLEP